MFVRFDSLLLFIKKKVSKYILFYLRNPENSLVFRQVIRQCLYLGKRVEVYPCRQKKIFFCFEIYFSFWVLFAKLQYTNFIVDLCIMQCLLCWQCTNLEKNFKSFLNKKTEEYKSTNIR